MRNNGTASTQLAAQRPGHLSMYPSTTDGDGFDAYMLGLPWSLLRESLGEECSRRMRDWYDPSISMLEDP